MARIMQFLEKWSIWDILYLLYLHKGSWALYAFYIFSLKVKYREEYEKNKGKSMLEFVETPSYQASKEAQKMQSGVSPFGLFSTVQHIFDVLLFERSQGSGSECLVGPEDPAQGGLGNHSLDPGTCLGHWALSFSHLGIRPRELLMSLSALTFCDYEIDTFRLCPCGQSQKFLLYLSTSFST